MDRYKYASKGFIIICVVIILLDFLLKFLIDSNLKESELQFLGGLISIAKVKNYGMALGFNAKILFYLRNIIQLSFLLLFLKVQRIDIHRLFKYSTTMVLFGWIGNYLDKFTLMNGDPSYLYMDYFRIAGLGPYINLSSILGLAGWILLMIAIIVYFKDIKLILKRPE